ncbi:hypothetical protein K5F27_16815 [Acinetobacter baumannii]|uniref:hypothetical protein n=1 Tax=Acinetobacter baumannii TaxID=470 RepID=UPI001FF68AEF|nr:hypothetical protein [Acinetobacter baumannii]MCJ9118994.1 hypothetical protein [Acinetobacter baumannii]MCJ9181356.1 hypothetical protein [Acinetobacter baumannii]MCJ9185080.1 hypothetical protein [Acinetobacter baumannii]MCJ9192320.1 hypothetical protein [Acinetobacter baumannii]MCJ9199669.1 hypothetical protein [Acinetobacter baumannii]
MAKFHEPVAMLTSEELNKALQWANILREQAEKDESVEWTDEDSRVLHNLNSKNKQLNSNQA